MIEAFRCLFVFWFSGIELFLLISTVIIRIRIFIIVVFVCFGRFVGFVSVSAGIFRRRGFFLCVLTTFFMWWFSGFYGWAAVSSFFFIGSIFRSSWSILFRIFVVRWFLSVKSTWSFWVRWLGSWGFRFCFLRLRFMMAWLRKSGMGSY